VSLIICHYSSLHDGGAYIRRFLFVRWLEKYVHTSKAANDGVPELVE